MAITTTLGTHCSRVAKACHTTAAAHTVLSQKYRCVLMSAMAAAALVVTSEGAPEVGFKEAVDTFSSRGQQRAVICAILVRRKQH